MYFAEMKRINREGPRSLGGFPRPARLPASGLDPLLEEGAPLVDTRPAAEYAARHVPGTLTVPLGKSFTTWAGSVLPYDRPFFLLAEEARVEEAVRDLAMIGLDRVGGYFAPGAVDEWIAAHGEGGSTVDVAPEALEAHRAAGAEVLDVRNSSEYEAGHLAGARNLPLGRLAERMDEIPRDRPLVVHCQSGARAGVAMGVLRANGFHDVAHLQGDFAGWKAAGRPVETGTPAASGSAA
jgi:hydroxyacylglutathione hydrolase